MIFCGHRLGYSNRTLQGMLQDMEYVLGYLEHC